MTKATSQNSEVALRVKKDFLTLAMKICDFHCGRGKLRIAENLTIFLAQS